MIDYKRIIKSRATRGKILALFSFVPDKMMLKLQYRIKTGRKLDLKNPLRFTEKIQWYKTHYKNPLMIQCVDKYDVREYIKSKGLEDILIPCYGVFDFADEINWEIIPCSFVMKDTLGGGGNAVIIVKDKENANVEELIKSAKKWTEIDTHKPSGGREWPYYCGKNHRIIIEKDISSLNKTGGIDDYKFFCFNGKVEYIVVDVDRYAGHKRNFYDTDWNNLHIISDCPALNREKEEPNNLDKMLQIASTLSNDFPFARVDLYNIDGIIYFGELTFYPWSGYVKFNPDNADFMFGVNFQLIE